MATNKPTGDNARKGAVKKRSQLKTTLAGQTDLSKQSKASGRFVDQKKAPAKKNSRVSAWKKRHGTARNERSSVADRANHIFWSARPCPSCLPVRWGRALPAFDVQRPRNAPAVYGR